MKKIFTPIILILAATWPRLNVWLLGVTAHLLPILPGQ